MDYEKKYKEALKVAQKLYQDCPNGKNDRLYHTTDLEKMFPELKVKESEDERIRKELIEYVKDQQSSFISAPDCRDKYEEEENNKYNAWIAWLEKQGDKCLVNFDEAEQEKYDFVSGQFIECRKSFNEFKEDNSYWFEYVGDDNYIGRSDNILNQKFHITPRQLFTLFTWQHRPKEDSNVNDEANAPTYDVEQAFEDGAQWQKEKMIDKACEFIETYPHLFMGVLRSEVIEDFKKYMKGE